MLLKNEIVAGEIYVSDKEYNFNNEKPSLWQMVEAPYEKTSMNLWGRTETNIANPKWENIHTGELQDWGTHSFTTIERMKRQYENIDKLSDKRRMEYVTEAYKLIQEYENSLNNN